MAARGWSKVTRMNGQATPNIASGRAMAKKANRARLKNTTGTTSKRTKHDSGKVAVPIVRIGLEASLSQQKLICSVRSRHALTQVSACPNVRERVCPLSKYGMAADLARRHQKRPPMTTWRACPTSDGVEPAMAGAPHGRSEVPIDPSFRREER